MLKKLLNKKMKFLKNQQGLTLIELLVVIVILGIIAAVAIPMVMGQQDNANKSTNSQNLAVLQDAVNRWYTLNNAYPDSLEYLALEKDAENAGEGSPFIKKIPSLKTFGSGDTACAKQTGEGVATSTGDWTYNKTTGTVSANPNCLSQ